MMQRSLLPTPGSTSSSTSSSSSRRSRCCQHCQLCTPLCSTSSSGGSSSSSNDPLQPQPPQQETQQQEQEQEEQPQPQPQQQQVSSEPWSLMARVVRSDRLVLGAAPRQRLAILAASRTLDISPADMEQRLLELVTLLPDVASLLPSLNPTTLAGLARDTQAVASKLIALRLLFPAADVSQMISRRPTLLLDEEFSQVELARTKLLARLTHTSNRPPPSASPSAAAGSNPNLLGTTGTPRSSSSSGSSSGSSSSSGSRPSSPVLDGLVSRQPLLLVAHVDELLDELERLLPAVDVMSALLRDPDLVTQVMCNRNLSIWLMPGVAVLQLLQNNPDCIYMVQRGTTALGPGAEFMGPG